MIMPIVDVVAKRRNCKVSIWVGRLRAISLSGSRVREGTKTLRP